jgi:hypothetical protein
LNVKHRVRDFALLEHVLIFAKFQYRFSRSNLGEKGFGVKRVLGWILHGSLFSAGLPKRKAYISYCQANSLRPYVADQAISRSHLPGLVVNIAHFYKISSPNKGPRASSGR